MTQVMIDDELLEKTRALVPTQNDEDIVRVALENYYIDVKELHKAKEQFEKAAEKAKSEGRLMWDPQFAGETFGVPA